jgi:response regulator RpfG family c-di-GMP phosphodiesterase
MMPAKPDLNSVSPSQGESTRERILLLVDDEENILSALSRLLRRDGYRILRANSGKAALEMLRQYIVGVIISDQRMPEMTGVEFLRKAKKIRPKTVRMVLSGYTELKSITDAINEGAIFKFLTKPWDDELLRNNVQDAFAHYELKERNIRLTEELSAVNAELAKVNVLLHQQVEQKTRDASFNLMVLQIAQDVLEYLPVAVIGIGNDNMVAVANRLAHEWLVVTPLLGRKVDDVLPADVIALYQTAVSSNETRAPKTLMLPGWGPIEVRCVALGKTRKPRGWIIVMSSIQT